MRSLVLPFHSYVRPIKAPKSPLDAASIDARKNLLRLIAVHSPVSWGHVNVLGEYDFSEKLRDTLDILPPKRHHGTIPVADLIPLYRRTRNWTLRRTDLAEIQFHAREGFVSNEYTG